METSVMHGKAVASLVLGICAIVCWFFGVGALVGIILGIIGLVLAGQAKKAGNRVASLAPNSRSSTGAPA